MHVLQYCNVDLFQGPIRINPRNFEEAYVPHPVCTIIYPMFALVSDYMESIMEHNLIQMMIWVQMITISWQRIYNSHKIVYSMLTTELTSTFFAITFYPLNGLLISEYYYVLRQTLSHIPRHKGFYSGYLYVMSITSMSCFPWQDGGSDILISTLKERNRALNGDIVAVEIKEEGSWKVRELAKC